MAIGAGMESLALALGFDLAGVTTATPSSLSRFLPEWLARGYGGPSDGPLAYVARRADERVDPGLLFEGAKSIVAVALSYASEEDEARSRANGGAPPHRAAAAPRVARYARGDDYHEVMPDRLRALASAVEALAERPVESRFWVDTGPVLERVAAARAGLGWIGKNTMLIHPRLGSYLLLGVLVTDLEVDPEELGEASPDHCGSCRACLDACPTAAFPEPYVLDATRCISYTTIEDPGPIPVELRASQRENLFGCDICQEVCPWNGQKRLTVPEDPLGLHARLGPRDAWRQPSSETLAAEPSATLAWVLGLDEDAWRTATRRSALRRAKRRGLLRNALVVAGNSGDPSTRPLIEAHARGDDVLLAEHARWALARLDELQSAPGD